MNEDVLTRSLRPKTFGEMIGQEAVVAAIEQQVATKRIPRSWMLCGNPGSGKTTLARILALSFQTGCKFGWPSEKEWIAWDTFDTQEINASRLNKVEDITNIADSSTFSPLPGSRFKILILDEAHRLTDASQNLLLKFLEDPPKTTIWLVCTNNPAKLLPTVRRRLTTYVLQPLTSEATKALVLVAKKASGFTGKVNPLLARLEVVGVSSPGLVVQAAEKYFSGATVRESVRVEEAPLDTLRICRAFVRGDWDTVKREMKGCPPEEARGVRLAILGYLRAILLGQSGSLSGKVAASILALNGFAPLEDAAYLSWLLAVCYQEAKRYR